MNMSVQMEKEVQAPIVDSIQAKNTELAFNATPALTSTLNQKPDKKPRQWAAWTRQEEENFFNALRQVGKNFEKITCRVQSKNKDQVRHYYYRLVRRMNKLLGPGFYLDAKNSKDTIAAMLRWWSLLEKFSCTASKLHLKPRRFKNFVEALENQLLKDRKKARRKQRANGDLYVPSPPSPTLATNRIATSDSSYSVKLLPVHSQESNKILHSNSRGTKGDLSARRTVRKKRRAAAAGSAAYRKWEKAAMAGVSLVADAAEQLERDLLNTKDHAPNVLYSPNGVCCNNARELSGQPLMKLKLQLFPINEATRKALEKDAHNPHLELTLSGKKRIASVLEHLNRKWGNCSIANGEIVLFPYDIHQEDLSSCQKWTMKDNVGASDVFISVGSPSVFRLRYGWFSIAELESGVAHSHGGKVGSTTVDNCSVQSLPHQMVQPILIGGTVGEQVAGNREDNVWADSLTNISVGYLLSEASKAATTNNNNNKYNTEDFVESCINITSPTSASCDSFDAAIAAHFSGHQITSPKTPPTITITSNHNNNNMVQMSMWSADETCDGFCFGSVSVTAEASKEVTCARSLGFQGFLQEFSEALENENHTSVKEMKNDEPALAKDSLSDDDDNNNNTDTTNSNVNVDSPKDAFLSDIYWPDSLGPLDLEQPSFKYQAQELVFSDSLNNSLTRMMASSLDAFRNLSFLGTTDS